MVRIVKKKSTLRWLLLIFLVVVHWGCRGTRALSNVDTNMLSIDSAIEGNLVMRPEAERHAMVRNPMMGWAIYSDGYNPDPDFWNKFDNIESSSGSMLKASDFATHLYIRWPWSALESEEGVYAWESNDFFKLLEKGALERGLKLAFRVYVDSRDYHTSSTPAYVQGAGAKGYLGNTDKWSPYPDDAVFQSKYEKFIKAFALRYDGSENVEFIDGFGLGKWGEGHTMILGDQKNYTAVFEWVTSLYLQQFKKVPLAINYHVEIGEKLINSAISQGFIMRHDAFGMSEYYGTFEKSMVKENFPHRPVIAESGF